MAKKEIKVEWCENWIIHTFKKYIQPGTNGGIEVNCFWRMAEESGLWERGSYGTPMSNALMRLTTVKEHQDINGNYAYSAFYLKEAF